MRLIVQVAWAKRVSIFLDRLWSSESRRAASTQDLLAIPRDILGQQGRSRVLAFRLVSLAWFALVVLRLFDLQVIQGASLRAKAARQQEATIPIPARRGTILDRHGRELALSTPAESIAVFADRVQDRRGFAAALSRTVDVNEGALLNRLEKGGFQWVKRFASLRDVQRARDLKLPALHFETESKRYYPHGSVASHVIGTVGVDHLGQVGLEQKFEAELSGQPGIRVQQYDARKKGYARQVLRRSVPGNDLVLELDLELQSIVDLELERAIRETKSQAGTVVLMAPKTGEVLALSNWPRFDPNVLTRTTTDVESHRNFALSYLVEPGSTFKVLTAAAALEERKVTVADVFDCEMGGTWVGRRRIRDHHPYGLLTMPQVLMKSSNVGIIKVGFRLGEQPMYDYMRKFGFGSVTGVGLPGEVAGLVRPVHRWSASSLASVAMGQEVGVTALQMARLFAAIANGGSLVAPRVVRALRKQDGTDVEFERVPGRRVISADTSATMQAILEQVVLSGTGRLAGIPGYRVAGKTGTAQMINPESRSYVDGAYLASFCGFSPVNDPALVGVVMLYDPRGEFYYGGRIAAPLFSSVVRRALRLLDVPPSTSFPKQTRGPSQMEVQLFADFVERDRDRSGGTDLLAAAEPPPDAPPPATPERGGGAGSVRDRNDDAPTQRSAGVRHRAVPEMRGLSLREALILASGRGIDIEPLGSGVALSQSHAPGDVLPAGEVLQIRFGPSTVVKGASGRDREAGEQ